MENVIIVKTFAILNYIYLCVCCGTQVEVRNNLQGPLPSYHLWVLGVELMLSGLLFYPLNHIDCQPLTIFFN